MNHCLINKNSPEEREKGLFDSFIEHLSEKEKMLFSQDSPVLRLDDMSFNNNLSISLDGEGDVVLKAVDTNRKQVVSLEFCNSGGRSRKTYIALRLLLIAMRLDNEESTHYPDGNIHFNDI